MGELRVVPAGVDKPVVDHPIAVVISGITSLWFGQLRCTHQASAGGAHLRAGADASADRACAFRPEKIVDAAVAIVIDTVAGLLERWGGVARSEPAVGLTGLIALTSTETIGRPQTPFL
jgi:hypothetical protein